MPRRILLQVFSQGVMPGPNHFVRSRMVACEPKSAYDERGYRLTSSILSIINWRAGLDVDWTPVELRDGDIVPPYPGRRYNNQDPRRLP